MEPLVSISLLTYNGEKYISDCLNAVFNQTHSNIEIIIIDNASEDKTVETTKEIMEYSEVRLPNKIIENKKNLGFAAGHNIGIRESRGEFILCLNQDVILDKDFIREAVEVFRKDSKIGAVQGKLLQPAMSSEQRTIDTTGLIILKNRRVINKGQGEIDQSQYDKEEEIFGVDGAAPVYRRKALEDIKIRLNQPSRSASDSRFKYYDEDFFLYKEDVDLSWRIRLYGWKIVYCPKMIAYNERTSEISGVLKTDYISIAKFRKNQKQYVKYYSFKNQRLMQIKNELTRLFLKHLPWILPKEIASWLYILFFERKTLPAVKELFRQIPIAWQKRKVIMANRKVSSKEMEKWFQ